MDRPVCSHCNQNLRAVNYIRKGKTYFRSTCSRCARRKAHLRPQTPRWQIAGYKKKPTCDRCGFRAKYKSQLMVVHVDGNLNNCALTNLKTICLNCSEELTKQDSLWKIGDLQADV